MDREVFTDPAVAGFANGSLLVYKVDVEKEEGKALARRFGIRYLPTFIFVDGEGKELDRQVGPSGKGDFLSYMKEVASGNHLAALRAKVEKSPEDGALRADLGLRLAKNEDPGAREHLEKAVALDPKNARGTTVRVRYHLAVLDLEEKKAPAGLAAFAKEFPENPLTVDAHRILVGVCEQSGDAEGEEASLEFLVKRAPEPWTRNGLAWFLATRGRDLERALGLADAALKDQPQEAAYLDTRAECLSRLGRHDEAGAAQEKAVRCLAEDIEPEVREQYEGRLAEFQKKRDDARAKGGEAPR